jgi:hypothetical protein
MCSTALVKRMIALDASSVCAKAHCAHCGDGDRSSSNSSEDLDHAVILATLAAQHFARTTWLAALALPLPGQLWFALRAVEACGAGFAAYCHD